MKKIQSMGLGMAVCALVVLLLGANAAWGQEVTASITGTVTDASGAPLAGASVTAKDMDRDTVWPATTNADGIYNILRIPVGSYSLRVEAKGFQTTLFPPFTLVLNQTARIDVQMKVGSVTETVQVSGETPLLQTQSTEVSTLIDADTTTALPLAARNYVQLTLLSPGATHVNPSSLQYPQNMIGAGRPFINGNREQANEFLLDGQLNGESKNNEIGYTPSVDAIQEFNLITQNASAEFGNYQGGVVSASIKSGTNTFHGDVFEFLRNDALNAHNWADGTTRGLPGFENPLNTPTFGTDGVQKKAEMRYNIFGGTIGGPVMKDKLFFFADYQGQRLVNAGSTGTQLFTQRERAGDFGQICTDLGGTFSALGTCTGGTGIQLKNPSNGNPIPNNNLAAAGFTISPVAQALFADTKNYPLPQINSVGSNNFFYNSGNNLNNDQGDIKIDYVASAKDHLNFRWSQASLRNPAFTGLPVASAGSGANIDDPVRNSVLNWTHTFTSNLLNEARIGFSGIHFTQVGTTSAVLGNYGEKLGISGANAQGPGILGISITGTGTGNPSLGSGGAVQVFHTTEGQFVDDLVHTRNRHTIKSGFQYVRERQDYNYGGNNGTLGTLSINNLTTASNPAAFQTAVADFWLGNVGGGFRDGSTTNTLFGLRGNIFGAYVQDDWRATPTLTVNLGLRFEDHTPLYEINNQYVNFGLLTGAIEVAGQGGNSRALRNNYLGIGDWEPRFGLAWSPAALGGKTVIRTGYAVSSYTEGAGANEELTQNPPFFGAAQNAISGQNNLAAGFGPTVPPCPAINFACYSGKRLRVTDPNFQPALVQQWNLTVQHQFNNTLTFQIGYVGQHGTHLLNFEQIKQLEGLDAAGKIAKPGELIVKTVPGPYLGGGTSGSLYSTGNIAGTNRSDANQRYDALQAVLQKRMQNGLQGQVAYTWSKCRSNSPGYFGTGWGSTQATSSGGQPGWQNIYDPRSDWGPCFFDQKHILSSYVTYQLPVGKGKQFGRDLNPVLNQVVGNWEIGGIITLHSGNALTLNEFGGWGNFHGDDSGTNGIGNYFLSERPSCSGPIHVVNQYVAPNPANNTPGFVQWFDSTNISHPAVLAGGPAFGSCSVGNFRGPKLAEVDLSVHKDFLITERKRLEFRAEAINAFNHPIHTFSGGPANGSFDLGSPVFGQLTGSQGARNLQFALKFFY
jgi:Carboxypeptidase regulatory-like domain